MNLQCWSVITLLALVIPADADEHAPSNAKTLLVVDRFPVAGPD